MNLIFNHDAVCENDGSEQDDGECLHDDSDPDEEDSEDDDERTDEDPIDGSVIKTTEKTLKWSRDTCTEATQLVFTKYYKEGENVSVSINTGTEIVDADDCCLASNLTDTDLLRACD